MYPRAEGCKIPARGKSRGPRGMYFPMHPDSRQCTSILSALAGKYWFCGVFVIWNLKDIPHCALACTEWALHHPKLLSRKGLTTKLQYKMLHSILWLQCVLNSDFSFLHEFWNQTCEPDSSRHLIHTYLESKIPLKGTNKCPFNPSVFLDNRWRWHQSMFHHILAEIPLFSYCKVFTNKRRLLFSHRSYWGVSICIVLHQNNFYQALFILLRIWANPTAIALTYCLPATYQRWVPLRHCWSIVNECFPHEDVFPILSLGSVRGNIVPRDVFRCTLPRAQGVYRIIWSL